MTRSYSIALDQTAAGRWIVIVLLVGGLLLEAIDLVRGWPATPTLPAPTVGVSPLDCDYLCALSGAPVVSWEPLRCVCGAPVHRP